MLSLRNESGAVKAAVLAFAVCLTGLTFAGCGSQSLSGPDSADPGLDEPVVIKYTVSNPLTYEEVAESENSDFDYRYIKVSGLKDKETERAVNDRIKAVYDELRKEDLPPYRGIKKRITANMVLKSESVYANVTGNFNNILSIMFNKYATYQDPGYMQDEGYEKDPAYYDSSRYFTETETLNIDLNTGREIRLKDLFCDNADYMELINNSMSQFLSKNHADDEGYYIGSFGELKLAESFKGLSEDQKFAIYPSGISFVFDYRTPQFETNCMAVCPTLFFTDFEDHIAVTKRFFSEGENIYISEEPLVKAFLVTKDHNDIAGTEYRQDGSVNVYRFWRYSSMLPEEIRNRLDQMKELDQEKLKQMKGQFDGMTEEELRERGAGAYEIMVNGNRVGDYINVSGYTNLYLSDYYEQVLDFHCYDGRTLKEQRLNDLFLDGYDYRPVVMEAIRNALNNYDGIYEEGVKGRYSDEQLEEVFSKIGGFNLATDAVVIPIRHPEKGSQTYGLTVTIPYQDFGCDHMSIFQ